MGIPIGKALCGCPRYLIEPPLSPGGETISCHHSAECKKSTPARFAEEKAVKPAAKKKATKSISQEV